MSTCKMTMLGMYNYDDSLFDGLVLPEAINKDVAVNEILIRCGEFEVVYPDIEFTKQLITHWGAKHMRTFQKWIDALNIEFDPLYNYDRFEEYEDNRTHKNNTKATNSSTMSSKSSTDTTTTNDVTLSHDVSAYDSATYQPRDKEVTDGTTGVSGTGSSSSDVSGSDNVDVNGNEVIKHTAHLYGNIGVTTSTQMLEDFIRVERFNIYEQIADIFVDEFCICIYE